jgi:adenosylcobinamide-phosphate synthase
VGRDTHDLDAHEIARAAIETLAESTCDGIVAPLFWFALGGVPGALAFKAASTLDSMIGHREPRYARFGAASARIDDVANFLPARAAAFIAAGAAPAPRAALRVVLHDAREHASPNAGWPEAAFAGALGVRLGGTNRYAGVAHAGAILNAAGSPPRACDVRRAIRLVRRTSALAAMAALVLSRRSPRAR